MEQMGSLIRRLRLSHHLSQKALCEGICAVSYLSKIEKGTARPGEEILTLLFRALGVEFTMDEAFLAETRRLLEQYFAHVAWMEDTHEARDRLLAVRETALKSPLTDTYTLFLVYEAIENYDREEACRLLESLRYRAEEMDEDALFFYALARGKLTPDIKDSLHWHSRANRLRPCSLVAYRMGECYHASGQYQAAIDHLQTAYTRAAEEGCPVALLLSSNLTAIAYADLYERELMTHYFLKTRRLAVRIAPGMIPQIDYNIGATLVSMRKSREALPYLQQAEKSGYQSKLLLYHKLAIACFDLGDGKAAKRYLRRADALLAAGKGTPIQAKLIEVVRFRLQKDYLQSEAYYRLLKEVYTEIGEVYHHGFKQFQGNLLVEACVHNRRYKEALRIAAEVEIFPEFME